jgi:hypothetical protein
MRSLLTLLLQGGAAGLVWAACLWGSDFQARPFEVVRPTPAFSTQFILRSTSGVSFQSSEGKDGPGCSIVVRGVSVKELESSGILEELRKIPELKCVKLSNGSAKKGEAHVTLVVDAKKGGLRFNQQGDGCLIVDVFSNERLRKGLRARVGGLMTASNDCRGSPQRPVLLVVAPPGRTKIPVDRLRTPLSEEGFRVFLVRTDSLAIPKSSSCPAFEECAAYARQFNARVALWLGADERIALMGFESSDKVRFKCGVLSHSSVKRFPRLVRAFSQNS